MVVILIILAWLGLSAGSFVNALVWRLHENSKRSKLKNKKLSIVSGRSICPHCKHVLAWYDLIPVVSWVLLKGKCRYCHKPISVQYPLVEITGALVFVLSYVFWPLEVHSNGQWLVLATWLASFVGLLALAVYDLRWMLLPNKIIYPVFAVAFLGRAVYSVAYETRFWHGLILWVASVVVASGIFFILFMVSNGKWIGYGDVRLGLITGTLLAKPGLSLLMIFLASLLGSLAALPGLTKGNKSLSSRLPYGPFLIASTIICIVFGQPFLDWYGRFFGLS